MTDTKHARVYGGVVLMADMIVCDDDRTSLELHVSEVSGKWNIKICVCAFLHFLENLRGQVNVFWSGSIHRWIHTFAQTLTMEIERGEIPRCLKLVVGPI